MSIQPRNYSTSDQTSAQLFYKAEAYLEQPIFRVFEYFTRRGNPHASNLLDNYSTKTQELAYRFFGPAALIGAAAYLYAMPAALPAAALMSAGAMLTCGIAPLALHLLAYASQQKNHIHLRTNAPEIGCYNPKIMTWNILGLPAGLNYTCGGQRPFRQRFPGIAELIHQEKPDTLILQECMLDAKVTEMIIQEFKREYAHFFIHNGPNMFGIESGLVVMTKNSVYDYSFTLFEKGVSWKKMRGFSMLKIKAGPEDLHPAFAIIGAHLEPGSVSEAQDVRKAQLEQIHRFAKELTDVDFVIFAGDLNISAVDSEGEQLDPVFKDLHKEGEPTCTNVFNKMRYPEDKAADDEWIDQIALILRNEADATQNVIQSLKVIPVFKNKEGRPDSTIALSDHNPLIATLNFRSSP
jgi:exonuclease III